jgi:hypothetical protein
MIDSIRVEDILSIFPAHDNLIQSDVIVIKLDMEEKHLYIIVQIKSLHLGSKNVH